MIEIHDKYDIIPPNEYGRKWTKRYKQYTYSDVLGHDGIPGWELQNYGCGPTSMATILSSLGYDFDPIKVARRILLDEKGNLLDFYTNKEKGRLGIASLGFVYLLQELKRIEQIEIDYQLLKFSYKQPELKKEEIIEKIKNDYMALVLVGPKGKNEHPRTFSNYGHYIAITSVNHLKNEFYVANPNKIGDQQIDTTYSYETIIENLYSNTFDFLMVKARARTLKK